MVPPFASRTDQVQRLSTAPVTTQSKWRVAWAGSEKVVGPTSTDSAEVGDGVGDGDMPGEGLGVGAGDTTTPSPPPPLQAARNSIGASRQEARVMATPCQSCPGGSDACATGNAPAATKQG